MSRVKALTTDVGDIPMLPLSAPLKLVFGFAKREMSRGWVIKYGGLTSDCNKGQTISNSRVSKVENADLATAPQYVLLRPKQYIEIESPNNPVKMTGFLPTMSDVRLQ